MWFFFFFLEKCRIQKCVNGGMFQRDLCKCNCSDNWSGDTCGRPTLNIISLVLFGLGAGRSSEVERSLMVRWVVGSILHGVAH